MVVADRSSTAHAHRALGERAQRAHSALSGSDFKAGEVRRQTQASASPLPGVTYMPLAGWQIHSRSGAVVLGLRPLHREVW